MAKQPVKCDDTYTAGHLEVYSIIYSSLNINY